MADTELKGSGLFPSLNTLPGFSGISTGASSSVAVDATLDLSAWFRLSQEPSGVDFSSVLFKVDIADKVDLTLSAGMIEVEAEADVAVNAFFNATFCPGNLANQGTEDFSENIIFDLPALDDIFTEGFDYYVYPPQPLILSADERASLQEDQKDDGSSKGTKQSMKSKKR